MISSLPFKYLDIPNFAVVSQRMFELISNGIYSMPNGKNTLLKFSPGPTTKLLDLSQPTDFWNFLDNVEVFTLIPELKTALDELGVSVIGKINLLIIKESSTYYIHSDLAKHKALSRINWPIINGTISKTIFYECNQNITPKIEQSLSREPAKNFLVYEHKDVISEIGSYVLTQPVAIDESVPHEVVLIDGSTKERNDYPRLVLSISIDKDLVGNKKV